MNGDFNVIYELLIDFKSAINFFSVGNRSFE